MNNMTQPSSSLFPDALRVLDAYYRTLMVKIAEEIVENRDDLDEPYAGRGEEIIDRYGHHLQCLSLIQSNLAMMANFANRQGALTQDAAIGNLPGFPVAPSGQRIGPDAPLEVGAQVLAEWGGAWWIATVISTEPNGAVRIHYSDWGDNWDETVARERLQEHVVDWSEKK